MRYLWLFSASCFIAAATLHLAGAPNDWKLALDVMGGVFMFGVFLDAGRR